MWYHTEPRYIVQTLTLLSGVFLSYQDIKAQKVNILVIIMYIAGCFLIRETFCPWPFVIFICLGILGFLIKKKKVFGEADYAIVLGSSFLIDDHTWPLFIALCGVFGIITSLIFQRKIIPFVPSIFIATVVVLVWVKIWDLLNLNFV
jgi:prepilin signal peptidase PulO-like enzyme (type II secretory pathway)